MREISTYIEQLLLHHDCVIVPGLGGFVVQDCPATYIAEEEVFLPPYRNVSFSPRLTMNDGLLVQYIAQECSIPYNDALHYIETEVAKCRRKLDSEGSYTIYGVGTLRNSSGHSYEFTPLPCGILSPKHYGLDSIYATGIGTGKKSRETDAQTYAADSFTLRIKMGHLRYAAVVAVMLLCYFMRIPLYSAINYETSEAGIFQQVTSLFMTDKDSVNKPGTPIVATSQPSENAVSPKKTQKSTTEQARQQSKNTQTKAQQPAKPADNAPAMTEKAVQPAAKADKAKAVAEARPYYAIVLASAVSHKGAEELVNKMKSFGDHSTREYKQHSMTRVIYGNFPDKQDAQAFLNEARHKDNAFTEAWVKEIIP